MNLLRGCITICPYHTKVNRWRKWEKEKQAGKRGRLSCLAIEMRFRLGKGPPN